MLFQHTVWKSTCGSSTGVGCFNTGFFAVKLLMGRQIPTDVLQMKKKLFCGGLPGRVQALNRL